MRKKHEYAEGSDWLDTTAVVIERPVCTLHCCFRLSLFPALTERSIYAPTTGVINYVIMLLQPRRTKACYVKTTPFISHVP